MLAQAAEINIKPLEFWTLTLKEYSILYKAYSKHIIEQRQAAVFLAWHTEAFARSKKLPDLNKVINRMGKIENKKQTVEEQIKVARTITGAFTKK